MKEKGERFASIGGVPDSIFRRGYDKKITGLSGKTKLHCVVESNHVVVEDAAYPLDLGFRASLSNRTLHLDITNKGWNGYDNAKHPDIYPAKLLEETFAYFEQEGQRIDKIEGQWENSPNFSSDNFWQYYGYLRQLKRPITEDDKKEAAKRTWTGKQAQKFGFGTVEQVVEGLSDYGDEEVSVIFKKSS